MTTFLLSKEHIYWIHIPTIMLEGKQLILSKKEWQARAAQHLSKAQSWTLPTLKRRSHGHPHPIDDFLFTYYPYPLTRIEQWHAGMGTTLEFPDQELPHHFQKHYVQKNGLLYACPSTLSEKERTRLTHTLELLVATRSRTGNFSCYGVHEWAMCYKIPQVRHANTPLRVDADTLHAFVESRNIRCSHFDAYRFFTENAKPMNHLNPTLETRHLHEQPGCLHANMDLYKWAMKSLPWVSGELLLDTFALAMELRILDMQASPYDLTAYGLEPIKIETEEGKEKYVAEQLRLSQAAAPLRDQLIAYLETTLMQKIS